MHSQAEQLATNQNTEQFNREERVWTDTATWLAESLNGSMRTSFEYRFDGRELYAEDGGAMGEVFDDAVHAAEIIASQQPGLLFELRRRLIEHSEYEDMLGMARGELPNTMIVVSDFPPELTDASKDVGGYNANRKQTMLRVITREENGNVRITTQSLDSSNRQALEAVYQQLGEQAEPGELLSQRIQRDLPAPWQENLIDNLTRVYDNSMAEQYGGNWHAGRLQVGERQMINTYEFVRAQEDLITWFAEAKLADPVGAERLRYKLAATAHQRFEGLDKGATTFIHRLAINSFDPVHVQNFYRETEQAEHRAATRGQTFSGCGASVGSDQSAGKTQLEQAGYGNKTGTETKYKFDKKMHCVVCQAKAKEDEPKKMCGPCGICRSCDKKLSDEG